jgi:hypothetical protein
MGHANMADTSEQATPEESKLQKADQRAGLVPEVLEALRGESPGTINVNILLQLISEKTQTSTQALEQFEQALKLARRYEDHQLETFKQRSQAIIDTKTRDPDEVDKRRNNARRYLKGVIAAAALVGLGGGLVVGANGGNIVMVGLLLAIGTVSIAMLGPLASGESISSNDVVRMIRAAKGLFAQEEEHQKQTQAESNRKKRRR